MDIDYGAVFGIDAEGAEVTEPAAPSVDTAAQGEKEQEPAAPAETEISESTDTGDNAENNVGGDTGNTDNQEDSEDGEGTDKQTPEERAKFAAARRKAEAERDAAVLKARREAEESARRTIDAAFKNSGLMNPYTQKPITSKAEFDEYRQKYDEEKKARILKRSGMSEEEYEQFVKDLPEVKAARQAEEQAKAEQAKVRIDEQLREISALDPKIATVADLQQLPNYQEIYDRVKRGYTIADAYKLANMEKLSQQTAEAAKQAALNAANGKQHLEPTAQRGHGAVSVPEDIRQEYLMLNPGMTDAEIQKDYGKYLRSTKKQTTS